MKLSGSEIIELRLALTDAFPSKASLKRLIRESDLGINIEEIVFGETLNDIISEIIDYAESNGTLDILIEAASEDNPGNIKLKAFVEKRLTVDKPNTLTQSDEAETAKTFTFEVVTVNRTGAIINRETRSAQYFTENLGSNVTPDVE